MFKIEKDVPVPVGRGLYPFNAMAVNDSFFVPLADGMPPRRLQASISRSAAASRTHKRSGAKFTVRQIDGGVRCWRIE